MKDTLGLGISREPLRNLMLGLSMSKVDIER